MPPAWVDFFWVLVQVKRDNVKQISVIVGTRALAFQDPALVIDLCSKAVVLSHHRQIASA
jgi:hypothetical protein